MQALSWQKVKRNSVASSWRVKDESEKADHAKEKSQDALTSDKWEPARWNKEAWILAGHGIGVWTKFDQISWKWQGAGAVG